MSVPTREQIARWRPEQLATAGAQYAAVATRLRGTLDAVSESSTSQVTAVTGKVLHDSPLRNALCPRRPSDR
ncbi:hypothetical protein [Nocardia sp. CNY236]|uniref:hypothetical protein n=1 Tax=Nocardia sp. CNY236 TaxID=1169152 RepID=UPI000405084F|nr:hypothetical protein [Nocardia sp. CNY236]